jgi:PmbA protein
MSTEMLTPEEGLELLEATIAAALRQGADAADALLHLDSALSASVRLGKIETIERAESADLGLRVFIGQRQAFIASSDLKQEARKELVERAIAMAKAALEDPFCGLAEPEHLARATPELDLEDQTAPGTDQLIARACAVEEAALEVKGICNSEGASAGYERGWLGFATSEGFRAGYGASRHGHSVEVLAGNGGAQERDYDFSSARYLADLIDPATVGRTAADRAIKRLNARKMESGRMPVFYDARVAHSLLGHLAQAINGLNVARGVSFLKDKLGHQVFAPDIDIVDDPLRRRGLRSRPFDGEGVKGQRRPIVDKGQLISWLLDSSSARQLKLAPTGHASRGMTGALFPAPSNLYLCPGKRSVRDLLANIRRGFYITELIGAGANVVTGDYSRGAAGFCIEEGELTHAVAEVTVAGNLKEMFRNLVPADDLAFKYGLDSPTVRIEGMTVGGR